MRLTSWMIGAWSSRLTSAAAGGGLALVVADVERLDEAVDVVVGPVGAIDEGADRRRVGDSPADRSACSGLDGATTRRASGRRR